MGMQLEIDDSSPEPVYEQIVRQVENGVRDGRLAAGMALPSIRQLATDLDLNHNTVARAYGVLERNRVIRTAGRRGTFVHDDAATQIESRNGRDAIYQFSELVRSLAERGLTVREIEAAFRAVVAALPKRAARST
jgi:GntR family transcriptional regulator